MFALVASPSLAEVVCDPENETHCAALIRKGDPSPLTGQVLTSSLAISLAQKAAGCDDRLALEIEGAQDRLAVQARSKDALHKIEVERLTQERDLFKNKVLAKVPWYETPIFVASVTAVVLASVFASVAN